MGQPLYCIETDIRPECKMSGKRNAQWVKEYQLITVEKKRMFLVFHSNVNENRKESKIKKTENMNELMANDVLDKGWWIERHYVYYVEINVWVKWKIAVTYFAWIIIKTNDDDKKLFIKKTQKTKKFCSFPLNNINKHTNYYTSHNKFSSFFRLNEMGFI